MNTRRNFILITASALSLPLTGCTENGGDNGNETNGETDLGASVSVTWEPEEERVAVTLDEIGEAERVDIRITGDPNLSASLYTPGDVAGLTSDDVIAEGDAEIDFDNEPILVTVGVDVGITATAVRGDEEEVLLDDEPKMFGDRVTATILHDFDPGAVVELENPKNTDYIYVVFEKDAAAVARVEESGDRVELNEEGLATINNAVDLSNNVPRELRERAFEPLGDIDLAGVDDPVTTESFDVVPPQPGDTVRIRAFAFKEGRAPNIVIDDEGQV